MINDFEGIKTQKELIRMLDLKKKLTQPIILSTTACEKTIFFRFILRHIDYF